MFVLRAQILGTAQDLDVSEESWDNAVEICEGIPELAAEIRDVVKVNGKKALKLANGARWKVKAANRRGGRGFTGDDVNLDELREHQNWYAWSAVTKTTLARRNAQIWAVTNAGDDKSVVLNELLAIGRAAVADPTSDPSFGLFEWSVPDGVWCTCGRVKPQPHSPACQLADPRLWAMALPALGYGGMTQESVRSSLNTDPDEVFLVECLCRRVEDMDPPIIPTPWWVGRLDRESAAKGLVGLSVDASRDLVSASIGMAGFREDGRRHWQELYPPEEDDSKPTGVDWVVPHLVTLRKGDPERDVPPLEFGPIGMDPNGPAGALINDVKTAGFEVTEVSGQKLAQAWGSFYKAVRDDLGRHLGQPTIAQAIRDCKTAPWGDTDRFSRKKSSGDICPLVAVTLADHQLQTQPREVEAWAMFAGDEPTEPAPASLPGLGPRPWELAGSWGSAGARS